MSVFKNRPQLTYAMKVGDQIAEIVSRNKDMSTEIVKFSVK